MSKTRKAIVGGPRTSESTVENYLPWNYRVVGRNAEGNVLIEGEDDSGWTLDDYVIPRLASGLIFCKEVESET